MINTTAKLFIGNSSARIWDERVANGVQLILWQIFVNSNSNNWQLNSELKSQKQGNGKQRGPTLILTVDKKAPAMAMLKLLFLSTLIVPSLSEHHHSKDDKVKNSKRQGIIPSEDEILNMASNFKKHHFDSIPNPPTKTTTTDVPNLFRAALRQYSTIDEDATDYLPAEVLYIYIYIYILRS